LEEIARLQSSRKAYKAHVTRLFKKTDELMLFEAMDQVSSQQLDTITQLESQIFKAIQKPNKLEEALLEV